MPRTDLQRFFRFIELNGHSECWFWKGSTQDWGYGGFKFRGKMHGAHRVSYTLFRGEIPKGRVVMHSCDNPICVNPWHLKIGTQGDNLKDCYKKRRRGKSYNHKSKSWTLPELADHYAICYQALRYRLNKNKMKIDDAIKDLL